MRSVTGTPSRVGLAEVAVQEAPHELAVLHVERLVETEPVLDRGDRSGEASLPASSCAGSPGTTYIMMNVIRVTPMSTMTSWTILRAI